MPQITLTEEQAQVVVASLQPVRVCDTDGKVLAVIPPIWSAEDIAEAKRRLASTEPRYSTSQVLAYLRSLGQR
jgi:hypothetical protein